MERTKEVIKDKRKKVENLVEKLIERETLSSQEFREILEE